VPRDPPIRQGGATGRFSSGMHSVVDESLRTAPKRILFVCRANQGRSPLAATILTDRLESVGVQPGRYAVTSAGLDARESSPVIPHVRIAAAALGLDLTAHKARALDGSAITSNSLILTMTEVQRGAISRKQPQALFKTFTLREVIRLGAAIPAGDGHGSLEEFSRVLHWNRARVAAAAEDEDIRDPAGLDLAATRAVVAEIDSLVSNLAMMLVSRTS